MKLTYEQADDIFWGVSDEFETLEVRPGKSEDIWSECHFLIPGQETPYVLFVKRKFMSDLRVAWSYDYVLDCSPLKEEKQMRRYSAIYWLFVIGAIASLMGLLLILA